jgi:hypothetical protein
MTLEQHRTRRRADGHYTTIANAALRDARLSFRARGVLAACLTHSEGFTLTRAWIDSHGTEGRDAITAAIAELRTYGYVEDHYQGGENPIQRRLVWTDDPVALKTRATENPCDGKPVRLKTRATENPSHIKKTNLQEDQENQEEQLEENTLCQTAPPAGSAPGQAGRKERKLRTTGSPDFEAFWRRYNQLQPRSASSKPKALAAWHGAINAVGGRLEALLDALERHAADVHRAKVSGQFMPELPACQKWLSEARWETVAAAADANTHHTPSSNGHHLTTSHGMIHL